MSRSLKMVDDIDWSPYDTPEYPAREFVAALRSLLLATGPEEVRTPYWTIENGAYPGGVISPVCRPLVTVFAEALRVGDIARPVMVVILDALFLILSSDGSPQLRADCAATVSEIRGTIESLGGETLLAGAATDVLNQLG